MKIGFWKVIETLHAKHFFLSIQNMPASLTGSGKEEMENSVYPWSYIHKNVKVVKSFLTGYAFSKHIFYMNLQ
jgi:hypothetical protein